MDSNQPVATPDDPSLRPSKAWRHLAWTLLLALIAVCYLPSLRGPYVLDDFTSIQYNPSIHHLFPPQFETRGGTNGRPLANLSYALGHALDADSSFPHHLLSLSLHLGCVLLCGGIVAQALRSGKTVSENKTQFAALGVAALWGLHPVQTETVAYLSQRTELLAGFFYLACLYGFQRAQSSPQQKGSFLRFSVLACLAGAASKEIIVSAPILVLFYDRAFVAGSFAEAWRQRKLYYLGLSLSWLLLALLMHNMDRRGVGFELQVTPWTYALTEAKALVQYARVALAPYPLNFDYGFTMVASLREVWLQGLAVLTTLIIAFVTYARTPRLGFLLLAPFILLAPSSSVIPIAFQPIAEHRIFLALLPFLTVAMLLILRLPGRNTPRIATGLIAAALAGLCLLRNQDYGDAVRLWESSLRLTPENSRAWTSLGASKLARQDIAGARIALHRAIELEPKSSEAWLNLAVCAILEKDLVLAETHLRHSLALKDFCPIGHFNLGCLLAEKGQLSEAENEYRTSITQNPLNEDAYINLAMLKEQQGELAESTAILSQGIQTLPSKADLHFLLARGLVLQGRLHDAAQALQECLRLKPDHVKAKDMLARLEDLAKKAGKPSR